MVNISQLLDRWLDPVGKALNPKAARQLIELQADEQTRLRVEPLADRNIAFSVRI
jgi:hypothetical protein